MKLSTQAFLLGLKVHQSVYENSRGLIGHRILLMPTLLLRTTGRKTGQDPHDALVYAEDAGRYLVCASNGGHDLPPAWLLNLEPTATSRSRSASGSTRRSRPPYGRTTRTTTRLFALQQGQQGSVREYQHKTKRALPVVVLTPT